MFEMKDVKKKEKGSILGVDIGVNRTLACSDGKMTKQDIHGHTLSSIQKRLSRRKKGSRGFGRAQEHRKRLYRVNRTGFYWQKIDQEPIVSDAQKTEV